MNSRVFSRLSFLSLLLVIVLLPIFSLPFTNIPVETSKGLILVFGLGASLVLWSISRFLDGKIVIPKSGLLLAGFGVALVMLLSSLFSTSVNMSLFGVMFDVGSFWFIFTGFLLMLFTALNFRTESQAQVIFFGVILSSAALLIFQSVHMFFPELLSLGLIPAKTQNLLGSWNALGIFAGFSALMYLLVVEFFPISKFGKFLLQIFLLLAILLMAAVNSYFAWILLGVSSLIIFVYKASLSFTQTLEDTGNRHFPAMAFLVLVVSMVFVASYGQTISKFIPKFLGVTSAEIGPSFKATASIAKSVIMEDPILGLGPNKFSEAWAKYKSADINNTAFWDVAFATGFGTIPTFMATTGVLGILAWLAFIGMFFWSGWKSIFANIKNGINWQTMALFVLSLYLLVSLIFYAAGGVIILLFFAFTGAFIGLASTNKDQDLTIVFLNDHRKSFISILLLIILVMFAITTAFKYGERFASVAYLRAALSTQEISKAQASIQQALNMNYNDLYLRTYSQVYVAKLGSLINSGATLTEEQKLEAQNAFEQAVRSAELAVTYDPNNHQNFRLLGLVYEFAGSLGVKDAYPKAMTAYENASRLSPLNPASKIGLSRVSRAQNDLSLALKYAEEARVLAPNDQSITDYINSLNKDSVVAPEPEPQPESEN